MSRIEREKKIIGVMVDIYCKKKHKHKDGLCEECQELLDYAIFRTDKCPFMETKTFCSQCKVHCYKKDKREKIRKVMRFSGPRMLVYHPVMAICHLYYQIKDSVGS